MTQHFVLIGVKGISNDGVQLLKVAAKNLNGLLSLRQVSSIYRIDDAETFSQPEGSGAQRASFDGLTVCFKAITTLTAPALLEQLREIEENMQNEILHRGAHLSLLAYDAMTIMTPSLTLPHPEFHQQAEQLIPAAEVWPEFVHPILKTSLRALVVDLPAQAHRVEFFAQGKTLLDF